MPTGLEGPWSIYEPGTLQIEQSHCYNHIASPDVHVDNERREIRMYYHGWVADRVQKTKVAVSRDGLNFEASPEDMGQPYFRVFPVAGLALRCRDAGGLLPLEGRADRVRAGANPVQGQYAPHGPGR